MPLLALLFLAWPFLEIAGFIVVGRAIGVLPTLALLIASIALGVLILRGLGFAAVGRLRAEFDRGRNPGETLGHSALIALAALLLIVPGFLSDIVALLLLLPPVRTVLIRAIGRRADFVVVRTGASSRVVDLDEGEWRRNQPETGAGTPQADSPWRQLGPGTGPDREPGPR